VGEVGSVGDPAVVLVRPEQVDVVAVPHGLILEAEAVAFDEVGDLPEPAELVLAVRAGLEVERLLQVGVKQDVVAPAHSFEGEAGRLS
jgi:hypothetical protein